MSECPRPRNEATIDAMISYISKAFADQVDQVALFGPQKYVHHLRFPLDPWEPLSEVPASTPSAPPPDPARP